MVDLSKVDAAHTDLHAAGDALMLAAAEEQAAQLQVNDLQEQLGQAEQSLAEKTTAREEATATYNAAADTLSAESVNAKIAPQSPMARFQTATQRPF